MPRPAPPRIGPCRAAVASHMTDAAPRRGARG